MGPVSSRIVALALAGKSRAEIIADTGTSPESFKVLLCYLRRDGILTHDHARADWPSVKAGVKRGPMPIKPRAVARAVAYRSTVPLPSVGSPNGVATDAPNSTGAAGPKTLAAPVLST